MSVIVDIDHETGDLSQYTSTVTDSGDLSVAAGAALAGTSYGLSVLIDDATAIYGERVLASPDTTGSVRLRYYLDPNSLTMGNGEFFTTLVAYPSAGPPILYAYLAYFTGVGYRVRCAIIDDNSAAQYTPYYTITDAPHYVEILLTRATNTTSLDGTLELWVDGTSSGSFTNLDYFTNFPNLYVVRLGAITGIDAGTSGTFYLDELVVNDDGSEIGPVVAAGGIPKHFMHYAQQRSV